MSAKKSKKMDLVGYFSSIPKYSCPRKAKLEEVMERCNVSEQTARNWCIYGIKPKDYEHVRILSEITGIPEKDLWQ